jgi:hypothetical protein
MLMTIITSQFENLKLVQEDLEAASTILANQPRGNSFSVSCIAVNSSVPLVVRTTAKYENNKYKARDLVLRPLNSESLPSSRQTHRFSPIEEQSKNSQYDIAVHTLAHPITRENARNVES